jgi:PAS domain S-box-containing protein
MRFRDYPIARKLVLITMLTSGVALLLAGAAFITYDLITFRQMVGRDLLSVASVIAFNSRAALTFNDPKAAEGTLAALGERPNILAACIFSPDGKVFAVYVRPGANVSLPSAPGAEGPRFIGNKLEVFEPIVLDKETIGTIYCVRDMQDMYDRLMLYSGLVLAVLFLSMLAVFGISAALQRVISRPILNLAAIAKTVSDKKDYSLRAEKPSNDELGVLTDGFNEMLAQIQTRDTALRESQQRLSLLVQNTPVGVVVWNPNLEYIEWNKSAERIFGYSEAEAIGKKIQMVIPESAWSQVDHTVTQLLTNTGGERSTNQNVTKDGRLITCSWYNTPLLDANGRVVAVASLVDDITQRVHAEEELKRAHDELEHRVEDRTRELKEAHAQLLETAHRAGMAEIATSVLHNVGNVLTGVNASASFIGETERASRINNMPRVVEMLNANRKDLGNFLTHDEKGKQLPDYMEALTEHLLKERDAILNEIDSLNKNIEHIRNIVSMQQSYAGVSGVVEWISLPELIEDAIRINSAGLGRHSIEIRREYGEVPRVGTEKHRVLQILVNLLSNAKYALTSKTEGERRITVRLGMEKENAVRIDVADTGVGIAADDLSRIFRYGFTTRREGHGFGLHSSAMAAQALGGSLTGVSAGAGEGAIFTLILPLEYVRRNNEFSSKP